MSNRREYLRWLWPYRFAVLLVLLMALLAAALDLCWPIALKSIIDLLQASRFPDNTRRMLDAYGVAILLLLVGKQASDTYRAYRLTVLNSKVIVRLRRKLFHTLLHLSLGDLSEMKSGGIVSRLSSDVDAVSGLIQSALIGPGVAATRIILTIAVLCIMSWRLAVAALIIVPPLALSSCLWVRRIRPIFQATQADRTDIDARVNEIFGGIRVVRAFRREPHEERSYAVAHHTIIRKFLHAERLQLVLESAWGVLIPLTMLTIVWYGGRLYLRGQLRLGDIFAFNIYLVQLLTPVWSIVSSVSQTQKSLAAVDRVFDATRMPQDKPDLPGATTAPTRVREILFENVSFGYRAGQRVLHHVNLAAPGGAVVALVGPSGAGKTTLTDLVARFHDPTEGRILLNGTDLRDLRLNSYRRLLAVVPQDVFLFDGTVARNLAYGRRGASQAEIEDAARRANAHDFILSLPDGYDTPVGERGFKLSGGQRQRLSIARALLADPRILILDEATSNLDTESEQLIQSALSELLRDRTTFVIAHRLSTVAHADLIVVMQKGRVRETGTHEQLLSRGGLYFEMVERQRASFGTLALAS